MWERRLERLPELRLRGGVRIAVADRPSARLVGLAGLREPPRGRALLIPRCSSIHTFGMRFGLDLIWLGADGEIVDVTADVRPGRLARRRHARAVVEARAGAGAAVFAAVAAAGGLALD
ncbi:MAG: uncharacterized protein QOJ07_1216 [Thermoleophilaceae bacterium]|nr:uncharacterized protein [Thermoleophilaceae bacterium]